MGALLFKTLFLGVAALLGGVAGWLLRGTGPTNASPAESEPENTLQEKPEFKAVETMMAQLQYLTATVAADLGEHNNKVREINDELTATTLDGTTLVAIVAKLVEANEGMQSQLAEAETRMHHQSREIEKHVKDARTDALTKVWNRRHLDDELAKCHESFVQTGRPSSMMLLDVDHFKPFNDTYGHQAGDEVLKGVARTLRKVAGHHTVCRYGGEEFAIVFPACSLEEARPTAEQARAAIADQLFEFEGLDLKVTASGGLAQFLVGESPADLVKRADEALYAGKENGRNRGYWHDGHTCYPMVAPLQPAEVAEESVRFEFTDDETVEDRRDRIKGLSDRKSFRHDVDRRIAEWKRGGSPLSVLLVEIDDHANIIDQFGEKAGELALRATAQFLKAAMREMDHIARYDDYTFALLLPGAETTITCSIAERLRTAIARCVLPIVGERTTFTVSLGSAEVADNDTTEELLARAQTSLVTARQSGGNCSFTTTADNEVRSMALSC